MLLRGAKVFRDGCFSKLDVAVREARIEDVAPGIAPSGFDRVFDLEDMILIPGFVDVHVHLREPGFSYKETIASGTRAAARGGYCAVCAMPNVSPPPDAPERLRPQLEAIERGAAVRVYPYGALTAGRKGRGCLSDMRGLAGEVIGFSDDGNGVQDEDLMREAMREAARLDALIAAHCEDESLLSPGGCVHEGDYARAHGLVGISSQSEWGQLARDLDLVRKTGCRYHACHLSTKESVELIRRAKAEGLPVTCETAPHYLTLCEDDLRDEGRFKMNPPLRTKEDREALLRALADGTIDAVATDHAPHAAEEKAKGLAGSCMGVVGLETAFPVLYTRLVLEGQLTLEQLIERMSIAPRRVIGLGGGLAAGEGADLTALDLQEEYAIAPEEFKSRGRATPFAGMKVRGRTRLTLVDGEIAWEENV